VEMMALMASVMSFKMNNILIPFYQHCWFA
jgi:hypothetical protein